MRDIILIWRRLSITTTIGLQTVCSVETVCIQQVEDSDITLAIMANQELPNLLKEHPEHPYQGQDLAAKEVTEDQRVQFGLQLVARECQLKVSD